VFTEKKQNYHAGEEMRKKSLLSQTKRKYKYDFLLSMDK